MKQTMKAHVLAAAALAAGALLADRETANGVEWTYQVKNGKAEISDSVTHAAVPTSTSGAVAVPAKLGGHPVASIGESAFYKCYGITGVTMPGSVTAIGPKAFAFCSNLAGLTIPSSVKSIGPHAFYDDHGLTSIAIPSGVARISEYTFYNCDRLASVTIPEGVTSVGESAFFYCSGLASVTLPSTVTNVDRFAFSGCAKLTKVKMPKIRFDETVFKGCPSGLSITYWENYSLFLKPNNANYGSVAGGGMPKAGTNVTIKATAKAGYVFVGWFTDAACTSPLNPSGYDNRSPTVRFKMPAKAMTLYAKFITVEADKAALRFSAADKKLATTAAKATAGSAFSLKFGVTSASLPRFAAKDLPKGLSIDEATGEIYGKATKPGSFTATVTVTDAAGFKATQKVKIDVAVVSWAKGTFYGTAKPGGETAYLQFTLGKGGDVSGKVKYKGKWRTFTSSCSYCSASKAKFTPKVKVGSSTFKPGVVTVAKVKTGGLELVEASDANGVFAAQRKAGLLKDGKALSSLVGKKFTITRADSSKLGLKKGDKLVVKLGSGDKATVSGVVGGKKLTAFTWAVLVSEKGAYGYTVYVDVVSPALKRAFTLAIEAHLDATGNIVEALTAITF